MAFKAGVIDWLPVRGFHHGPRRLERPEKRPQIRLQSVLLAITSSIGDSPGGDHRPTTLHLTEESRYGCSTTWMLAQEAFRRESRTALGTSTATNHSAGYK